MRRFTIPLLVVAVLIMSIVAANVRPSAVAQEASPSAMSMAGHPLAGTWLVDTPEGLSPATFAADGSVVLGVPPSYADPQLGLTFQGPLLGRWEPDGERSGRFTVAQALSDADGAYAGIFLFEGFPEVDADGQTFVAGKPQRVVFLDAANNVAMDQVVQSDPPVTATRIGADLTSIVFPAAMPATATPTT